MEVCELFGGACEFLGWRFGVGGDVAGCCALGLVLVLVFEQRLLGRVWGCDDLFHLWGPADVWDVGVGGRDELEDFEGVGVFGGRGGHAEVVAQGHFYLGRVEAAVSVDVDAEGGGGLADCDP